MNLRILAIATVLATSVSGAAVAQSAAPGGYSNPVSGAVSGTAAGAATGANAAGPLGAVVGGALGIGTGAVRGTANTLTGGGGCGRGFHLYRGDCLPNR